MSSYVLDASAVLAVINGEPGRDTVRLALEEGAAISAVNLAEVVTKLQEKGFDEPTIRGFVQPLGLEIHIFDEDAAFATGLLRSATRSQGLSLGDRACLALAGEMGLPALTADRNWLTLDVKVRIELCR